MLYYSTYTYTHIHTHTHTYTRTHMRYKQLRINYTHNCLHSKYTYYWNNDSYRLLDITYQYES